jgi:hypothetical protein
MASPVSLLEWDTEAVQSWLFKLGFGRYENAIYGQYCTVSDGRLMM